MILIEQPNGTGNCGQCVMAMLAGQNVASAIEVMGEGRTSVESLANDLARFGVRLAKLPKYVTSEIDLPASPGAVLIEVATPSGKAFKHWIAWDGYEIFDPKFGRRATLRRTAIESVVSAEFFSIANGVAA